MHSATFNKPTSQKHDPLSGIRVQTVSRPKPCSAPCTCTAQGHSCQTIGALRCLQLLVMLFTCISSSSVGDIFFVDWLAF
jgi:hypothetical protein